MEEEEMETEKCEKPVAGVVNDRSLIGKSCVSEVEIEKVEEPKDEDFEEIEEAEEQVTVKGDSGDENSDLEDDSEDKSESEDKTESEERTTYQPYSPHEVFYEEELIKADVEDYEEVDDVYEELEEMKTAEESKQKDLEKPLAEEEGIVKNLKRKEPQGPVETNTVVESGVENGKKKGKEEKPPTKVVVRRLPPSMTLKTFLEQVSPLPPVDYSYFIPADMSMGINAFSRAYLNFINQEDLFAFTRTFDNYVFLDAKGQEYPAIVEFAPFQRVPKQRSSKKKDPLCGTIEADPAYSTFRENMEAEALENSKPGANTVKQHYFETENVSSTQEISTTPLLEFLKIKRAEKARMKEERREEKRRKEAERKLKQKAKEKKQEAGEDEETTMSDVKIPTTLPLKVEETSKQSAEDSKKIDSGEQESVVRAKAQSDCLKRMLGLLPAQDPQEKMAILKKEEDKGVKQMCEVKGRTWSSKKSSHRYSSAGFRRRDAKPAKPKKKEFSLSEGEFPPCPNPGSKWPSDKRTTPQQVQSTEIEKLKPLAQVVKARQPEVRKPPPPRPLVRPTCVIDKALNTDNILPRAFSKSELKTSASEGSLSSDNPNKLPEKPPGDGAHSHTPIVTKIYRRAWKQ